jgi:hypothetical protein
VPELEKTIIDYLATNNLNPKPFVWTAKADDIFAKVARAKQALESVHYMHLGAALRLATVKQSK